MRENIVPSRQSLYFTDTLVKAVGRMTVSGQPSNNDTFVLGSKTYTLKSTITAAVAATATLTSDETQPDAGDTVTVGDQVYTFVEEITAVYGGPRSYIPNEVLIGADADATLANLVHAVNQTGTAGTNYSMGTVKNPLVSAAAVSSHATVMTARSTGTGGNAIVKAEDSDHLDWDGSGGVFTGGVDTVANEIKIGASAAATLDNIKAAVNATGTPGTEYSVGTEANATVSATTNADTTQDFEAITGGTAGNSIVFTESMANTTISGSGTLGGTTSGGGTVGSVAIGNYGGILNKIIFVVPQLTGTPTLTPTIKDADGNTIATIDTVAENATSIVEVNMSVRPTDKIVLTSSSTVESNLAVVVEVR